MAYRVLILGAGKIGATIAKFLCHSGDYMVTVGDINVPALDYLKANLKKSVTFNTEVIDVSNKENLIKVMQNFDAVISACSFNFNVNIAQSALQTGISYFDLTEDVGTTNQIRKLAGQAKEGQIFMPQCGLAPGFIGILAHDLCEQFEKIDKVKMRVGALPQYPSNKIMYNLTWSTDGLINEYCNPCQALVDGELKEVLPLEGLERFSMDGMNYEAFNTSGGLGTLCETLLGKVNDLNYKTVRYKGHCYLMSFLTQELKLADRRDILKDIMENALPITFQDVVLVFCEVSGWRNGQLEQISDVRKIYHSEMYGEHWSSIQITTAASICAVLDLFRENKLPGKGFIMQEQVSFKDFSNNRFGQYYQTSGV